MDRSDSSPVTPRPRSSTEDQPPLEPRSPGRRVTVGAPEGDDFDESHLIRGYD